MCADVGRGGRGTAGAAAGRCPTAREIAATSSSALPNSASLTDPEVSITTQTRGGIRRRLGNSTPGTAADRRDGRR
ncbi:hypothetical protein ABH925_003726 [Streptacidiphilus sp. EB129]